MSQLILLEKPFAVRGQPPARKKWDVLVLPRHLRCMPCEMTLYLKCNSYYGYCHLQDPLASQANHHGKDAGWKANFGVLSWAAVFIRDNFWNLTTGLRDAAGRENRKERDLMGYTKFTKCLRLFLSCISQAGNPLRKSCHDGICCETPARNEWPGHPSPFLSPSTCLPTHPGTLGPCSSLLSAYLYVTQGLDRRQFPSFPLLPAQMLSGHLAGCQNHFPF